VPELADDIARAEAQQRRSEQEVSRAEAAHEAAHLPYQRLLAVEKSHPNLIAQQELDLARENDRAAESSLAAARSQVEIARAEAGKLRTMLRYSRITAPFAGVITRRYADPGALIQAGTASSTQALPLVRLSSLDRLRLVFPVSVSFVDRIHVGDTAEIRVPSRPSALSGVIARSAQRVDPQTRKMDVEVDVPNPDGSLVPGMYASVVLKTDRRPHTLTIPVTAIDRGRKNTAFVVDPAGQVQERTLALGVEGAQRIEVLEGLAENERVLVSGRHEVRPGQRVEARDVTPAATP